MKCIDLSVTLENDKSWAPFWARNKVTYQNHAFGRRVIRLLFGVGKKLLKPQAGWANEMLKLSSHGTTHVDAPWHYAAECDGKPARTIDQLPLEWFFAPGVKLDMTHKSHGEEISTADVQQALETIGHTLQPGEIVLIHTGGDKLIGRREYFTQGPGMSAEATGWLIDQGIKVMGIDAWGWDRPLPTQAQEAKQTGRDDVFWAAHFVGIDKEYCHMERLANLDKLPAKGFKVCAFPLKIKDGSAGPARVVALLEQDVSA